MLANIIRFKICDYKKHCDSHLYKRKHFPVLNLTRYFFVNLYVKINKYKKKFDLEEDFLHFIFVKYLRCIEF